VGGESVATAGIFVFNRGEIWLSNLIHNNDAVMAASRLTKAELTELPVGTAAKKQYEVPK
jgi:hypothetical protein